MTKHFDLIVIGAGSGGVACARASAALGAKVAICENNKMGGTCVNRGCVPKKLYVTAANYATEIQNAKTYGWETPKPTHNWQTLKTNVFNEITRLNTIYDTLLKNTGVHIYKETAQIIDPKTIKINNQTITADKIMIATGGHPNVPDIPGIEHTITSDQAFHLPTLPEKITIVGGGYIAVEFATIFNGLGVDTTLIIRGETILRGFDQDIRNHITTQMQQKGIKIQNNTTITKIKKTNSELNYQDNKGQQTKTQTVMVATGRTPNTANQGLENTKIETTKNGAIKTNEWHETSEKNIYAIGDVTDKINLTPVAINEGRAFAETHYGKEKRKMDYTNIPTAVFCTPPIGTIGLTEEQAQQQNKTIEIYQSTFKPMKYALSDTQEKTLIKLIVDKKTNKILGLHMAGQDAPEITQGFAAAIKAGATKKDFDQTIGIHPTSAEELVTMRQPKPSKPGSPG